jgi:hypothetical protein
MRLTPNARQVIDWTLRLATAAALAIDAYVHADLADLYERNRSSGLSQGDLFRIEAAGSALAALLILLVGRRLVWALAFVVAASALGGVMIYANYDLGALGPIPDMYEPSWYGEKTLAAVAEAVATATAALGFLAASHTMRRARHRAARPETSDASARA